MKNESEAVTIDKQSKERTLESKYMPACGPALDNADGVRMLIGDYHALRERQYAGDYDAVVILVDLASAIERACLTDRQRQAVELVYFADLTQVDAANRMGCSKQTVNRLTMVSLTKIARVYEKWARYGEGYSLSGDETKGDC